MKHLYTLVLLLILSGTTLFAQEPLTDKIVIEFMKPGDPDAQARNYNLVEWPNEAKAAAYKAAEIWASYLEITVPIRVKFGWCDNIEANAMGGSSFTSKYDDGYFYPYSLLDQLSGRDVNPNVVDIICVFKSNVNWYFGLEEKQQWYTDSTDPTILYSKKSIIPTMLHEICHGLGFTSSFIVKNGHGDWGSSLSGASFVYDKFLVDQNGNNLLDQDIYKKDSENLYSALTSDNIFWSGHYTLKANSNEDVKINAPNKWSASSICHIDSKYGRTINDLMSNGKGDVTSNNGMDNYYTFSPGPIVLGMLQDIGWTIKSGATATDKIQLESPIKVYTSGNDIVIEGCEQTDKVMIYDFSGRERYAGNGSGRVNLPSGLYVVRVADQTYKIRL